MKTQDLITLLAQQAPAVPKNTLRNSILKTLALPAIVSLGLLVGLWGINPDLNTFAHTPAFWIKEFWVCGMILGAWPLVLRLSRPGVSAGRFALIPAGIWGLMFALGIWQISASDPTETTTLWMGMSWNVCSISILALALPLLAGLLWTLRDMAPTRPAVSGAMAGLLAGGISALIYSLHCPENAFAFLSLWYAAGVAATSLVGAVLGARLLRW